MNFGTALRLGRVSNLPTVWSNVLAGLVLSGGEVDPIGAALLGFGGSALYVGGMYLNDAFDADIDARERPERPIPAGEVRRETVFRIGGALLATGLLAITLNAFLIAGVGFAPIVATLATAGLIVLYNAWHKGNPAGPLIMGLCRVGLYFIAATSTVGGGGPQVIYGAALLLGYVLGLTYVAKFEGEGGVAKYWPMAGLLAPIAVMLPLVRGVALVRLLIGGYGLWIKRALDLIRQGEPPAIRRAVGALIAGISLLDALLIARCGESELALVAVGTFGATLIFQRKIAGT